MMGTGWRVQELANKVWREVHVTPVDDLREHPYTALCWCTPRVERQPHGALVVHHAADMREAHEARTEGFA